MVFLAPDNLGNTTDKDRRTDGDNDQGNNIGLLGRCNREPLQGDAKNTGQNDRQHDCQDHGHAHGRKRNRSHASNHQKLALGEVDDVTGVVDEGKAEGYQGVSRTDSNPGEQVL